MRWRQVFVFVGLFIFSTGGLAWSGAGHRVVAQIAYDHLTPKARQAVDRLTFVPGQHYSGRARFVYISTWADVIRAQGDQRFTPLHFIDLPVTLDGTRVKPAKYPNVVSAIQSAEQSLHNPTHSLAKKRESLKLLVHFVGDIHQPLHAADLYSHAHPQGDHGGNSYHIKYPGVPNLHALWDRGLGLFKVYDQRYPLRRGNIRKLAHQIELDFPEKKFSARYLNRRPNFWAQESRVLAVRYAYKLKENTHPSNPYRQRGKKIVKKRLALAGYRLANELNRLYKDA